MAARPATLSTMGLASWFATMPAPSLAPGELILHDERDAVVYRKAWAKVEGRFIVTNQRVLFYAKQNPVPFLRDLPIPAIDSPIAGARITPHEQLTGGIEVTPGRHAFDITFARGDVTVVETRDANLAALLSTANQ